VSRCTDGPHLPVAWDLRDSLVKLAHEKVSAALEVATVPLGLLADVEDPGPPLTDGRGELVDGSDGVRTHKPSCLDPGLDAPLEVSLGLVADAEELGRRLERRLLFLPALG